MNVHSSYNHVYHSASIGIHFTHVRISQAAWPCDSSSSRVALVASRREDPVQALLAGSQVASGTHAGIYLKPPDIGCQYSRSIYTACFIVWHPRRAADTSTNWRQSLFCCCTTSLEQATNGVETAAIDGLVSSWSANISVLFCLWAPGYGLTLWCALGLLVGGAIQVPQLHAYLIE